MKGGPVSLSSDSTNDTNNVVFGYWCRSLLEIFPFALLETMSNKMCFESMPRFVIVGFDFQNPFWSDCGFSGWKIYKSPSIVVIYGIHFKIHGVFPIGVSKGKLGWDWFQSAWFNNGNIILVSIWEGCGLSWSSKWRGESNLVGVNSGVRLGWRCGDVRG